MEQIFVLKLLAFVRERFERPVLVILVDRHQGIDDPVVVPIQCPTIVVSEKLVFRQDEGERQGRTYLEKTIMRAQVEGGIKNNL